MAEAFLYEPVLIELKRLFESVGVTASLEITATTGASDKVAQAIVPGHDILFAFLNGNRPDILGVDDKRRWIVAEIKDGGIGLEEVYQAKKYKELFSAPFGSLSPRLLFRLGSGVCVKYAIRFYDLPTTIARFWSSRSSIRTGGTLSIGSQTIHLINRRTISTDYLWENRSESTKIGRANSTTG